MPREPRRRCARWRPARRRSTSTQARCRVGGKGHGEPAGILPGRRINARQFSAWTRAGDGARPPRHGAPGTGRRPARRCGPTWSRRCSSSTRRCGEGDPDAIRDELGDLLLHLAFQIVIAEERGEFYAGRRGRPRSSRRWRRRHPHLFDLGHAEPWERAQAEGAAGGGRSTGLTAHPARRCSWPTGCRSARRRSGSTGPTSAGPLDKVREELAEVEASSGATDAASPGRTGRPEHAGTAPARRSPTRSATCCSPWSTSRGRPASSRARRSTVPTAKFRRPVRGGGAAGGRARDRAARGGAGGAGWAVGRGEGSVGGR